MKKLVTALVALAAFATTPALAVEQQPERRFQLTPYVGAFIPTGDQRDLLDDAVLTGLTLSYDVHRYVAVVGSFGWTPSSAQGFARDEDVDVFQYDLGLQGQYPLDIGRGFTLKPFVGAGVGARTYSFRDLDVDDETDFAGYVALGTNLEYRNLVMAVTMRDYISDFDGIGREEDSSARNDLAVFTSFGLRF